MSEDTNDVDVKPSEAEVKAKQFGWVTKDEWQGDESQWRPAEEFLRRGEEVAGFVRKDLERVKGDLAKRDLELAEIKATMEEFRKYHNETEARAYKRALDDLKTQKAEAVEMGDGKRVVEIDEEIGKIKEVQQKIETETKKPVPKPDQDSDKAYYEWEKTNSWYVNDAELHDIADGMAEVVRRKNPNLVGIEFLEAVTKKVKEIVPEKFENPNRQAQNVSSSSDGRAPSGNSKKKSYENLPADAKEACDKFVKQKLMTREQYVAEYSWD